MYDLGYVVELMDNGGDGRIFNQEILQWCDDNCEGEWLAKGVREDHQPGQNTYWRWMRRFTFTSEKDAILFKLRWE